MSLPSISLTPNQSTVDLGNGFKTVTNSQSNSDGLPTSITSDSYQNGILIGVNTETFTYANGLETVNWSDINKQLNISSSGSYTTQNSFQNL